MKEPAQTTYNFWVEFCHFSKYVVLGELGIYLDAKHVIKRYRCVIISYKRDITLVKRPINRTHIIDSLPELQIKVETFKIILYLKTTEYLKYVLTKNKIITSQLVYIFYDAI